MKSTTIEVRFNVLRKLLASMAIDQKLYDRFTNDPRQVMIESNMPRDEMDDVLAAISSNNKVELANAIGATGPVSCAVPVED